MKSIEEVVARLRTMSEFEDMDEITLREHARIYLEDCKDEPMLKRINKTFKLSNSCEEPSSAYVNQD